MERWEFLIQKEGDRVWTAINQPTWELEEGRYRMVAHSSQPNFEVEIRITHQSPHSERHLSQIQSCFRRTNGQGLIMILPFTYFEPGIWELRCYSDLMSELLGQGWQEKVQLQVSSKIRQEEHPLKQLPEGTLEEDNSVDDVTQTESRQQEISNEEDKGTYYLQKLEQLLRQKIEPMLLSSESSEFIPIAQTNATNQSPYSSVYVPTEPSFVANFNENNKPALRLLLNQNYFNRSEGEPILIAGTVEVEESNSSILLEFKGKLRYELQEPETEQVILIFEELVAEKSFPFIFNYALEIPTEWEMDFLMAEVILETEAGVEVARQTLTITTDLTSDISNPVNYTITLSDPEEKISFAFDLLLDEEIVTSTLNLNLPQPSKMAKINKSFQPSEGQILPPKIGRTSDFSRTSKIPQLPQIRQSQSIQIESVEVEDSKSNSQQTAPVDHAFQSLELKERFFERLSSLAGKPNS